MAKSKMPQDAGTVIGKDGETHQQHTGQGKHDPEVLTTNFGVPISDNQNSLRAGERGPTLLEDFVLREKIFHLTTSGFPSASCTLRGSGVHGVFRYTKAIHELTRASLFQKVGDEVPVFVRFPTVTGSAGSVDTLRDVRVFAVKFYTKEGNWDLIHSVKMEADRGYPQAASAHDTFSDFASLMCERAHMLMWAMSDRVIPRSLRMMHGFGVHTFRLINIKG